LPTLCEERGIPYIFVPSREAVGGACKTKRPTSCVFIELPGKKEKDIKDKYDSIEAKIRS